MAVKKCCIENCKSCSTRKEDKGVTFHKFPKDVTSRNEWQCITKYKHTQKDLPGYVCSRHFCKGDFQKNEDSKYILKSGIQLKIVEACCTLFGMSYYFCLTVVVNFFSFFCSSYFRCY